MNIFPTYFVFQATPNHGFVSLVAFVAGRRLHSRLCRDRTAVTFLLLVGDRHCCRRLDLPRLCESARPPTLKEESAGNHVLPADRFRAKNFLPHSCRVLSGLPAGRLEFLHLAYVVVNVYCWNPGYNTVFFMPSQNLVPSAEALKGLHIKTQVGRAFCGLPWEGCVAITLKG